MLSCSFMSDSATPWIIACQSSLTMEFSKQEYWDRLPFPTPGDLPNPGFEPASLVSPMLADGFFTTTPPGKQISLYLYLIQLSFMKNKNHITAKSNYILFKT